jgi:hypothetical protein
MKRVIFHRRLRLPEGNYLVPTTKCQNLTVRPQLIRTEVQRNLFPILVIHYVAWNSGGHVSKCQHQKMRRITGRHWLRVDRNLPGYSDWHRHWPFLPHLGFRCHLAFDPSALADPGSFGDGQHVVATDATDATARCQC